MPNVAGLSPEAARVTEVKDKCSLKEEDVDGGLDKREGGVTEEVIDLGVSDGGTEGEEELGLLRDEEQTGPVNGDLTVTVAGMF